MRGASNLQELHGVLQRSFMIRRLKKDVSSVAGGGTGEGPAPCRWQSRLCVRLLESFCSCHRLCGHPAAAQVLDELPEKIRKRVPIEADPAHRWVPAGVHVTDVTCGGTAGRCMFQGANSRRCHVAVATQGWTAADAGGDAPAGGGRSECASLLRRCTQLPCRCPAAPLHRILHCFKRAPCFAPCRWRCGAKRGGHPAPAAPDRGLTLLLLLPPPCHWQRRACPTCLAGPGACVCTHTTWPPVPPSCSHSSTATPGRPRSRRRQRTSAASWTQVLASAPPALACFGRCSAA